MKKNFLITPQKPTLRQEEPTNPQDRQWEDGNGY